MQGANRASRREPSPRKTVETDGTLTEDFPLSLTTGRNNDCKMTVSKIACCGVLGLLLAGMGAYSASDCHPLSRLGFPHLAGWPNGENPCCMSRCDPETAETKPCHILRGAGTPLRPGVYPVHSFPKHQNKPSLLTDSMKAMVSLSQFFIAVHLVLATWLLLPQGKPHRFSPPP